MKKTHLVNYSVASLLIFSSCMSFSDPEDHHINFIQAEKKSSQQVLSTNWEYQKVREINHNHYLRTIDTISDRAIEIEFDLHRDTSTFIFEGKQVIDTISITYKRNLKYNTQRDKYFMLIRDLKILKSTFNNAEVSTNSDFNYKDQDEKTIILYR